MIGRRLLAVVGLTVGVQAAALGFAVPASAHPLGNFSVNHANDIVVSPDRVQITHVVDLAEIPTVQAMPEIDADGNDEVSAAELAVFAGERCADDVQALTLSAAGAPVMLRGGASSAVLGDGQAGLNTLRVECEVSGETAIGDATSLAFVDAAADVSTGWSEVTLRGDEVSVDDADVPTASPSADLTAYPADRESSPMRVSSAAATVSLGGGSLATAPVGEAARAGSTPWQWAADLLGRTSSAATGPLGMALALIIAIAVGAAHALAPGHGKSLVAFALAGRQERAGRAALTVGATVTATHTASVLVLGLVVAGSASVVPAGIYPVLTLATGAVILVMGGVLLRNALRAGGHGHDHGHDHDQPGSGHSHGSGSGPTHSPADEARSTVAVVVEVHDHDRTPAAELPQARRSLLVTLGVTGGLLPSPSAVVVLLAAVAAGRAWYGVMLVLAFGIGMAVTLAGVGFAVLRGQERLFRLAERSPLPVVGRLVKALPMVTAFAVAVIGAVVMVSA